MVFAGCVSGGLWKSHDGGNKWSPINDAASNLSITCIYQNPLNPLEIYYGTGEYGKTSGDGIFKSTDGGQTFNALSSTSNQNDFTVINCISHSLTNASTVYVGTMYGLFQSIDAGKNWQKIFNGNVGSVINFADGHILVGTFTGGIYYSANGSNFSRVISSFFPNKADSGKVLLSNSVLFPNVVYTMFGSSAYSNEANLGIYKSSDGGLTWGKRIDSLWFGSSIQSSYGSFMLMLKVHPSDTNKLIIGAMLAKISKDGGKNFNTLETGHSDNVTLCANENSNTFYCGNDGGISKGNWNNLKCTVINNEYNTTQFYGGSYAEIGDVAIAGSQDNGTWYITDSTMTQINGGDGGYSFLSLQDPSIAYSMQQGGFVYLHSKFDTYPGYYQSITPSSNFRTGVDFINLFQMNMLDSKQLYYKTRSGIIKYSGTSNTWERLHSDSVINIKTFNMSNSENPSILMGGMNCFYRLDSVATIVSPQKAIDLTSTIPTAVLYDNWGNITFHPKNNNTCFASFTNPNNMPRIYKIEQVNSNPIWTSISGNLPSRISVYQVQAHPESPDSVLFAATSFGLYYTTNGGITWEKETRIPNVMIFEMKLRPDDNALFLFTFGRSAYRLKTNIRKQTSSLKKIEKQNLSIYPNPSRDYINVVSDITLNYYQIFDLKGREILNSQTSKIDISNLNIGTYIVRAYDDNGIYVTTKFIKE